MNLGCLVVELAGLPPRRTKLVITVCFGTLYQALTTYVPLQEIIEFGETYIVPFDVSLVKRV